MRTIFFCILAATLGNLNVISAPADEDAATSGQKWLAIVDDQKYEESWNEASSMFRNRVTQNQWIAVLKRSREPLGALVSRNLSRINFSKSLPGANQGDYAIIHFTTSFTGKRTTEQLTLVKEEGRWQMVAYSICCGWK